MVGASSRVPFPIQDAPVTSASRFVLPPDHFLAQRPANPQPVTPEPALTDQEWIDRARPDTSSLAAADFDIDVRTGFLPPDEPVQSIAFLGHGWEKFEAALERARTFVFGLEGGGVGKIPDVWRQQVEELPAPALRLLSTLPLLRRAHVLISFLGHFYIHSKVRSLKTVPASISIPWIAVSDRLGVPPILTYADTVLWNWHYIDPKKGWQPGNLSITTTFTSSKSEVSFFLLSLLCELEAAELLRQVSATLDESFFADSIAFRRIAGHLAKIRRVIGNLTKVMQEATAGAFGPGQQGFIVPAEFYWEIRPWFNGGEWDYSLGAAGVRHMNLGGPSAGQSTLVHALDVWLGVDHRPKSTTVTTTAEGEPSSSAPTTGQGSRSWDDTFMMRMAAYMPVHHRQFLSHLATLHTHSPTTNPYPVPSLRDLASRDESLGRAYNETVDSMKRFRDMHMRLVTVYIISQASRDPPAGCLLPKRPGRVGYGESTGKALSPVEARTMDEVRERATMMGTGGTELVSFLKACRDRTKEAAVSVVRHATHVNGYCGNDTTGSER